ncbi:MAG: hypothetical protein H0W88_04240 [Parachlamydiaceae bacterium]|nr:hypothetical protein [Parachlamydiaceae bacterium]
MNLDKIPSDSSNALPIIQTQPSEIPYLKINKLVDPILQSIKKIKAGLIKLNVSKPSSLTDQLEILAKKAKERSLPEFLNEKAKEVIEIINNPSSEQLKDGVMTIYRLYTLADYYQKKVGLDKRYVKVRGLKGKLRIKAMKRIKNEENLLKLDALATAVMLTNIAKYAVPAASGAIDAATFLGYHSIGLYKDQSGMENISRLKKIGNIAYNALGSVAAVFSLCSLAGLVDKDSTAGQVIGGLYLGAFTMQTALLVSKTTLNKLF